jgi:CubicO group peptidase (beta-lactamase class C family)
MKHFTRILIIPCLSLLVVAGLLLGLVQAAYAADGDKFDAQALDAFLKKETAASGLTGLSVVVVKDDQVVFSQGYGQAGHGRPVTSQTQFYLGSISKSFTALAVMQLVEQGKIELDAPVQRYLPWFQVSEPEDSAQITVRHLLNQTSGLAEKDDPGVSNYAPTLEEQVRRMRSASQSAPAGTRFMYNSQNYRVLGLIIEKVSGQSYAVYMRSQVFTPLGMAHTACDPSQAPELAQGFGQLFGLPFPRSQDFRPAALPSGYLISTSDDLGSYLIAMLNQGRLNNRQIVQPKTLETLFTPLPGIKSEYGMGWVSSTSTDGIKLVYHDGNLENFHALIMLMPEKHLGFAILSNQNSIYQQLTGHNRIMLGVGNLIVGDSVPTSLPLAWLNWILAAVVFIDLGIQVLRLVFLPKWARSARRQFAVLRWLRVLIDLLPPLVLFILFPSMLSWVIGESAAWSEIYGLTPDIALWLWASMGLAFLRGLLKLYLLLRPAPAPAPAL